MDQYAAHNKRASLRYETPKHDNELPRELILNLMAQGYPLEELMEFFPMFTLDQLMLLIDPDVIH